MTEVCLAVNLPYPPHVVWQALTVPELRDHWFIETDLVPVPGAEFRIAPQIGLQQFEQGFVVRVDYAVESLALVMTWDGPHRLTTVEWRLFPNGDGTELEVTESGFFGIDGAHSRMWLYAVYAELFNERLPRALDAMAEADAPVPAPVPRQRRAPRPTPNVRALPADQRPTARERFAQLVRTWPQTPIEQRRVRAGACVAIGLIIAASLGALTVQPVANAAPPASTSINGSP